MTDTPRHINQILAKLSSDISNDHNQLGYIIDLLHERGFGILIFLFALPMAIPLPVPPGINLLFSVPLLILAAQQIIGTQKPWLPQKIRQKSLSPDKIKSLIKTAEPWLDRLSFFIRPRLGWMTQGYISNVIGVFGFMFALCVCIPIPMTNTVPSFAILLMALGILMRDGLAILAGMVIGSGWILVLATLGIAGFKALIGALF
jgi:hypothetical protein